MNRKRAVSFNILTGKLTLFEFGCLLAIAAIHISVAYVYLPPPFKSTKPIRDYYAKCQYHQFNTNETEISSKYDTIFTHNYNGYDTYLNVVKSLRAAHFRGQIVVFNNNTSGDDEDCGIKFVTTYASGDKNMTNGFRILYDSYNHLMNSDSTFHRIAIIDPERVYFLGDPFAVFKNPSLVYLLKRDSRDNVVQYYEEECLDLWNDQPTFFDTAFISADEYQMKGLLSSFIENEGFNRCKGTSNEKLLVSNICEKRNFAGHFVNLIPIICNEPGLTCWADDLIYQHKFGTSQFDGFLPSIVLDWKNEEHFPKIISRYSTVK